MASNTFPTLDVMSAASGFMLVESVDAIYKVLQFASGGPVWTNQLPRVGRELRAAMLARRPELQAQFDYIKADCTPDTWRDVADEVVRCLGETMLVETLSEDEHERIDPHSELIEHVHPDRITTIILPER